MRAKTATAANAVLPRIQPNCLMTPCLDLNCLSGIKQEDFAKPTSYRLQTH